jgi:hypothetical protein
MLAFAVLWIWQNPNTGQSVPPQRVDTVEQQIRTLSEQVQQLAQRPSAASADLTPLEQRLAALESRKPSEPDLGPIQRQIATLQAKVAASASTSGSPSDLSPLEARLSALEKQLQDLTPLRSQLDGLGQQQSELSKRLAQLSADQLEIAKRLQALDASVRTQEADAATRQQSLQQQATEAAGAADRAQQQAAAAAAAADRATKLLRLQSARNALAAGEPLGKLDAAPPALARFAETKPPTESDLRLTFPQAAEAALAASKPETSGKSFGERLWQRAQGLVTIREGDRVLVGDPVAGALADARNKLDAGDLGGAVAAVSGLTGPAAQAMAPWLENAKALLEARQALDSMAAAA